MPVSQLASDAIGEDIRMAYFMTLYEVDSENMPGGGLSEHRLESQFGRQLYGFSEDTIMITLREQCGRQT